MSGTLQERARAWVIDRQHRALMCLTSEASDVVSGLIDALDERDAEITRLKAEFDAARYQAAQVPQLRARIRQLKAAPEANR